MPFDLSPLTILAMWAGGVGLAAAVVGWWRIVGAGYFWTVGGSAILIGVATAGMGPMAVAALVSLAVGAVTAGRWPVVSSGGLAMGGFLFLGQAAIASNPWLVLTGAAALGGTTSEMLLGHWFLVDPTLPRRALRRLDAAGVIGLVTDAALIVGLGGLTGGGLVVTAYLVLAVLGLLMMVGVWFSLGERGYEGVMAATGLSYLSVLTTLGMVSVGRFLVG